MLSVVKVGGVCVIWAVLWWNGGVVYDEEADANARRVTRSLRATGGTGGCVIGVVKFPSFCFAVNLFGGFFCLRVDLVSYLASLVRIWLLRFKPSFIQVG